MDTKTRIMLKAQKQGPELHQQKEEIIRDLDLANEKGDFEMRDRLLFGLRQICMAIALHTITVRALSGNN